MRAQVLFVAQFPLVSFLLLCESVAVQGYNMQVSQVGKYFEGSVTIMTVLVSPWYRWWYRVFDFMFPVHVVLCSGESATGILTISTACTSPLVVSVWSPAAICSS